MNRNNYLKSASRAMLLALTLSTTLVCAMPAGGWAMLVPARAQPVQDGQTYDRAGDMKAVQTALESKIVRERLKALGLSDKEIESRLTRLSDQQVHKLSKDIKAIGSGGAVTGILELIILVIIIVLLVRLL
jgi:ribose 1,5-bisphosphokinase PhnN